jgi:hypothetical protein
LAAFLRKVSAATQLQREKSTGGGAAGVMSGRVNYTTLINYSCEKASAGRTERLNARSFASAR